MDGQSNTLTATGDQGRRAFSMYESSSAEKWEQFERQRRAANSGLPRESLDATPDLALHHLAGGCDESGAYRAGRYIILTSFVVIRWTGAIQSGLVDILVGT
jgi:hypothetical protein